MPRKKEPKTTDNGEVTTRTLRPRPAPQPIAEPKKTAKSKEIEKKPPAPSKGKKRETSSNQKDEPKKKIPLVDNNQKQDEENEEIAPEDSEAFHNFKADNIEGKEVPLSQYKGHVCLVVNVASKCGHTSSNYKELVELHNKYADKKGLRILAFPCNQFGKQEPGDNEKICEFAKKKNVAFDMFAKINVNGKNAHPLWKWLTSQKDGPKGSKIDWNFTKFLIDKEGHVVERFQSAVKPLALVDELEKLW
ncbi:uncharacterized protein LOC126742075 [Anthonomus grandis grandis]|uniref:uncharacterized protein LOC126742075 n=1 Tax=Anthonomus grandis grandis TaxID=2921223 RepID=UPI00216687B6|nr:uncharacterized protein LOC126742075 [Anthonomus grandis grandis]